MSNGTRALEIVPFSLTATVMTAPGFLASFSRIEIAQGLITVMPSKRFYLRAAHGHGRARSVRW